MAPCPERIGVLADKVARLAALRRSQVAERKVGIILYGFPPNAGAVGTAAYLSVFESLHNTLHAMAAAGYDVTPARLGRGAAQRRARGQRGPLRQVANVLAHVPADDIVARTPWLSEIEAVWGPAPAARNRTGAASSCWGRSSARSPSASSRSSAMRATRCDSCSSMASPRPMPSRPSIAGCARSSGPMRCCISACTARSSSCRASRRAWVRPAGPTG